MEGRLFSRYGYGVVYGLVWLLHRSKAFFLAQPFIASSLLPKRYSFRKLAIVRLSLAIWIGPSTSLSFQLISPQNRAQLVGVWRRCARAVCSYVPPPPPTRALGDTAGHFGFMPSRLILLNGQTFLITFVSEDIVNQPPIHYNCLDESGLCGGRESAEVSPSPFPVRVPPSSTVLRADLEIIPFS